MSIFSRTEQGGEQEKIIGYCMKCKAKREIRNPEIITMKNGMNAAKGTCPICGTKMFKIIGKAK